MARRSLTPRPCLPFHNTWSEQDAEELFQLAQQGGPSAVRVAKALLSRGLPPDFALRRGLRFSTEELPVFTWHAALHVACISGNTDVANTLLRAKADPNLPTGTGLTPLHLAVRAPTQRSRRALCVSLLYHGADHSLQASNGLTAAEAAEVHHGARSKLAVFLRKPPSRDILKEEVLESDSASSSSPRRPAPLGLGAREMLAFEASMASMQAQHSQERSQTVSMETYSLADCKSWTRRPPMAEACAQELCGICLAPVHARQEEGCESSSPSVNKRERQQPEPVWWLPCEPRRHVFHAACVRPWLQRSGACPTCRAPVLQPRQPLSARGAGQHRSSRSQSLVGQIANTGVLAPAARRRGYGSNRLSCSSLPLSVSTPRSGGARASKQRAASSHRL